MTCSPRLAAPPSPGRQPPFNALETVAGECLGCRTQFAIDVRLPRSATCPDCGADVLARADIEGPAAQRRLPFDASRVRGIKR